MRAVVNRLVNQEAVPAPTSDALAFHQALPGYRPTPVHELDDVATELGLRSVLVKDESDRLDLPSFKILGASWAVERTLAQQPSTHTLIAASAGNHGRAVAHAAALRGLNCRVFLPSRSLAVRREAIAAEGAEVVVVDGAYEEAVDLAALAAREDGVALIADVGAEGPAEWVIDGYATLFAEAAAAAASCSLMLVPVGVGSLAAAAARHAAQAGVAVIGVEPATAACLTASLQAAEPTTVPTPGTTMAGLDCAEVSQAAWPTLKHGIAGTITVSDDEVAAAMSQLAQHDLSIGESGAAPLAGLHALMTDPGCADLRDRLEAGSTTDVLLVATEGRTGG